ncbi:hypothetical protein [Lysinibacillus agricola]|uniref:hypothetical protein n=1 Tax=Lysinibacillus agricola TaxID=2590012 RepID=UPI003C239455
MRRKLEELKIPIVNDFTTGGSDKALSAESGKKLKTLVDEKADGKDLRSFQTEVTEHLADNVKHLQTNERDKISNSVQRNQYNDNAKMNLGSTSASRSFGWFGFENNTTSEEIKLRFPALNTWGIGKLTLASTFANSDASGGAEIIFHAGSVGTNSILYQKEMNIVSMTDEFANNFYITDLFVEENRISLVVIKRQKSNQLSIKLEFNSYLDNAWNVVSGIEVGRGAYQEVLALPIQKSIFKRVDELSTLPAPINAVLETGWSLRPNNSLTYYKDVFGVIHIYGRVDRNGGTPLITTLPSGYRPIKDMESGVVKGVTGAAYIDILTDGKVYAYSTESTGFTNVLIECSFRTT